MYNEREQEAHNAHHEQGENEMHQVQLTHDAHPMHNLLEKYIMYVDVKESTFRGYSNNLKAFARWIQPRGIEEPKRSDIIAYKSYLSDEGYSAGTQQA